MTTTPRIGLRHWLLTGALLVTFATGARAALIPLEATLTGAQETPPNTSPGTGTAAFILDDVARVLISAVSFTGLSSPTFLDDAGTSAHIHMGLPGESGPIIRPFLTAPIGVTSGSFADVWTGLTTADISAIETGDTYINIHTVAFPTGEIRGQITAAIPEPSSWVLGAMGILCLLGYGRHHRRRAVA